MEALLDHIEAKEEDKRSEIEQQIWVDLQELRRLNKVNCSIVYLLTSIGLCGSY